MKVGDLIRVVEERACGGVPNGAIGLVLEEDNRQKTTPRWLIMWISGNEMSDRRASRLSESMTYGHGTEVICDLEVTDVA
jgi:hypothetical protein